MALSQHHVSKRSTVDYMKIAAFGLMVTFNWAAKMASAEDIDWSILLTTVIISTSAESQTTSRIQAYDSNITSRIYSNETNNKIMSAFKVKHTLLGNAPNKPIMLHKTMRPKKTSSSNKLNNKFSLMKHLEKELEFHSKPFVSVIVKEPTSNILNPHSKPLHIYSKSLYETRHSIRLRSVESNKCRVIHGNTFCLCNDVQIFCDGLNISSLAFLEPLPADVKHFSAARNRLRSIPIIPGASNLLELSFAQNKIDVVNPKELVNFTKLEELDLPFNRLQKLDLSEGTFSYLLKLNASFNKLTRFESQSLPLVRLYLQNNMLSDVHFLSRFRSLKHLNLSSNRISYIPSKIFQNLTDLYLLDLQNNQITNADFVQFITKVLHTLVLSNNRISSFPAKSFRDSKIVELYLDNNTIKNADFLIYSNAADINLNDNQLSTINGKLFENKNKLKVLNVSGMKLTSMDFITSIPSLISFGMESNNISCLPKGFLKNYKTLTEWFLFDNPLEDLVCQMSSEWAIGEMCNISTSNSIVQIRMKDVYINDIMRCVLDHRNIFEDCEQKCNFASHTLFPPLLIFVSTLFNVL